MTSTLRTLLDRVEKGEGADREIDADVMAACFPEWAAREPHLLGAHCAGDEPVYFHAPDWLRKQPVPRLTSSIDAAMALVEKVLPGWTIARLSQDDHKLWHAELREGHATSFDGVVFSPRELRGLSPSRALLGATLRAKIAQEERA